MLNWVLAAVAAALWTTAYSWYFVGDLRRWLWRHRNRKLLAEAQRAQAYAAWTRRPGPPRARAVPPPPQQPPAPPAQPAPPPARTGGVVIPFPTRRNGRASRE